MTVKNDDRQIEIQQSCIPITYLTNAHCSEVPYPINEYEVSNGGLILAKDLPLRDPSFLAVSKLLSSMCIAARCMAAALLALDQSPSSGFFSEMVIDF